MLKGACGPNQRVHYIYLEHSKIGSLVPKSKQGRRYTMTELDIELTAACNRLRIMIRNEQQLERNAEKWDAMAKTSTIQRRIKNEVNNVQVNVSFNKR